MNPLFSLRILVADGDPDGLRIVDKLHRIGKTLVFPQALRTDGEGDRPRATGTLHLKPHFGY